MINYMIVIKERDRRANSPDLYINSDTTTKHYHFPLIAEGDFWRFKMVTALYKVKVHAVKPKGLLATICMYLLRLLQERILDK